MPTLKEKYPELYQELVKVWKEVLEDLQRYHPDLFERIINREENFLPEFATQKISDVFKRHNKKIPLDEVEKLSILTLMEAILGDSVLGEIGAFFAEVYGDPLKGIEEFNEVVKSFFWELSLKGGFSSPIFNVEKKYWKLKINVNFWLFELLIFLT